MARHKNKSAVEKVPKSSKGIKVEIVKQYLSTFTTVAQIAEFTAGDKRQAILSAVEEALVKLAPPKEKTPEVNMEVTIDGGVSKENQEKILKEMTVVDDASHQGAVVEDDDESKPRRFKLVKKNGHRGPAIFNGVKLVPGVKYVEGDIVTVTDPGIIESEIKRLFGNKSIWEEL